MEYDFYTLGVLYLVYSFAGWVGETVVATVRGKHFANRGAAAGPFCFVYGSTAVLLAVGFTDLRSDPVYLFFACTLASTVMEWLTAKLLERLHRRKWWDYSGKRFNLPMEGYTYFFTYEETLRHRHRDFWQLPCAMGADLSLGDDFCSFTFLFPLENGYFGVKTRDYITSYTLSQLPLAMRQKYEEFMNEGTLQVFDGTVLDMMQVYDDLDAYILQSEYDVRAFGYDPYNAKEFVERWAQENGPFGIEKVIQGARTESVPLGELKKLSEQRKLLFDEALMEFAMGNCITLEDTNGNRKLYKQRHDKKIDAVAALMDAYVAWKLNRDAFE